MLFVGPPTITTHPTNKVVNASVGTTLNCKATSGSIKQIQYTWEVSSADREQWIGIPFSNGETLVVRNLLYSEKYRCIASNDAGSTTSNTSTVILMGKLLINHGIMFSNLYIEIITQPLDSTVIALEDATLTCLSSIDDATYLWYRIGDGVPTRSIGQDNSTLIIPEVTPYDEGMYYCMARKEEITVESNRAVLSVNGRQFKLL